MKIYLAARYSRRLEMLECKKDLEVWGLTVIGRWLLGEHQIHDGAREVQMALPDIPDAGANFARDDFEDVLAADIIISFTETPRSENSSRGGRHVEFGIGLAPGKRLIIVGPRENVFHCLPQVERYWTWQEALARAMELKYEKAYSK